MSKASTNSSIIETHVCYNCGSTMRPVSQYNWHDDELGDFSIECNANDCFVCDNCGEERHSYQICIRMEEMERARKNGMNDK